MPLLDETMYVVRVTYANGSVYYKAASGTWAVPKLYRIGYAKSAAKTLDRPWDKSARKIEVVPVSFVFGEPILIAEHVEPTQ